MQLNIGHGDKILEQISALIIWDVTWHLNLMEIQLMKYISVIQYVELLKGF